MPSRANQATAVRSRGAASTLLASCLLLAATPVHAEFPDPAGPVSDFADLLTQEQEQALLAMVREVESSTTAEMAVATVRSLDGLSVEEYANRLFVRWGVGHEAEDNGVLILVAPNDRELRIEVGDGPRASCPMASRAR